MMVRFLEGLDGASVSSNCATLTNTTDDDARDDDDDE